MGALITIVSATVLTRVLNVEVSGTVIWASIARGLSTVHAEASGAVTGVSSHKGSLQQ